VYSNDPLAIFENTAEDIANGETNEVPVMFRIDAERPCGMDSEQGNGVIVAVIDTGIDITQEDIAEKYLGKFPGEIPGDGLDNDGDGLVDDVNGGTSVIIQQKCTARIQYMMNIMVPMWQE